MKIGLGMTTVLLSSALVSSMAYAAEPAKCPGIGAILAVNVSKNTIKVNNEWIAGRRNQIYDTTDHWTFILGNISAASSTEAYTKAVAAMNSLTFQAGPIMQPNNKWVCIYNTDPGYPGIAITSPIAFQQGVQFIR